MDRREALKRIAAGSTVALGITEITSSHAFADGGTVARRPSCAAVSTINAVAVIVGGNYIRVTVTAGLTTCPGTGTPQAVQYRYRSSNTVRSDAAPATVVSAAGTWGTSFTATTVVRLTSAGSQTNLPTGTVTLDVLVRRVCNNGTRRAWCCIQRQRSGNWTGVAWGGSFGAATTDPTGCDTPAPT